MGMTRSQVRGRWEGGVQGRSYGPNPMAKIISGTHLVPVEAEGVEPLVEVTLLERVALAREGVLVEGEVRAPMQAAAEAVIPACPAKPRHRAVSVSRTFSSHTKK